MLIQDRSVDGVPVEQISSCIISCALLDVAPCTSLVSQPQVGASDSCLHGNNESLPSFDAGTVTNRRQVLYLDIDARRLLFDERLPL